MTHDRLTAADVAGMTTNDNLIMIGTAREGQIEITRDNQMQLERELAGTFDNPLAALMAQVVIEYREMSAAATLRKTVVV